MLKLLRRVENKISRVRSIAGDPDRKPLRQIARDLSALGAAGESPGFYFERLLYRKGSGSVGDYVTGTEAKAMYSLKAKGPGWLRNFDDKLLFDQLMRPSGLPLPVLLGSTRMGAFVSPSGDVRPISTVEDLVREMSAMVDVSDTGGVFAKPVIANKGVGAFRVTAETLGSKADALLEAISNSDYLFQEVVRQHDRISALYPNSLNTFRVLIGQGAGGARPLSVVLRMGSGGRSVDNTHAGGICVNVDVESGKLRKYAHELYLYGGRRFVRHPDTGVVFDGYEVPLFEEVMDVVRRAHEWLPHPYSGWDIGVTPSGPVVIESNPGPYLLMMDVAHGGLKGDANVREFFEEWGVVLAS